MHHISNNLKQYKMTKGVKITVASLIGVGIASLIFVGYRARQKGWSHSKFVSKTFKVPLVDKQYVDLGEQVENQLTDEQLKESFR